MTGVVPVERSYETLVACPQCAGAVNSSLEVERGILDTLTRLALSPAWQHVSAPRLEGTLTRLIQDYEERIQLRLTREPLDEQPIPEKRQRQPRPPNDAPSRPRQTETRRRE